MRLSAAAAASRRRAVRRGAHQSPRWSAARRAAVESACAPSPASASMIASCSATSAPRGVVVASTAASDGTARLSRSPIDLAHDQLARGPARLAAAIDHRERLGRADLHDGADGVALHLRVGVVEQQ